MEDKRMEQIEALECMAEYLPRLKNGMVNVADELDGARVFDTDEYLDNVIKGLNWVIQVFNRTLTLINEKEVVIDYDEINKTVIAFCDAYDKKDDKRLAACLKGDLLKFVDEFYAESKKYAAKQNVA